MRIIADHLENSYSVINDGCIASNVGAGMYLRMIIRRMYYNLILLNNSVQDWYNSLFDEIIDFVASQYKLSKKEIILKWLEDELLNLKKP
jgi:alanyl-tRNA synthetase